MYFLHPKNRSESENHHYYHLCHRHHCRCHRFVLVDLVIHLLGFVPVCLLLELFFCPSSRLLSVILLVIFLGLLIVLQHLFCLISGCLILLFVSFLVIFSSWLFPHVHKAVDFSILVSPRKVRFFFFPFLVIYVKWHCLQLSVRNLRCNEGDCIRIVCWSFSGDSLWTKWWTVVVVVVVFFYIFVFLL